MLCIKPGMADLWRICWARNKDIGPGIDIVKVKARVPNALVQQGVMTFQDWCGNGLVDTWAKAGCAQGIASSPVAYYQSR